MALGISERLLERVFAPIDLSYAYKKVENISSQLAAFDAAEKKEAAKQYQQDLAALNKDRVGVRAADVPEATNLYQEWSNAEKQLANNPNLINKNPELYGQLKTRSDETYSKLQTLIRGSKELGKQEISDFEEMSNPKNMDYYMDGAAAEYRKNVIGVPWSQVSQTGSADKTKYYETKIGGEKFFTTLGPRIESQATAKHEIIDTSFKGVPGEVRKIEFQKMPMLGEIHTIVADNLIGTMGNKAGKFAVQQLGYITGPNGDYENVKKAYNDFFREDNPNGVKKYFDKPQQKVPLFEGDMTPIQMYTNYVTAKQFLSKLPEGVAGKAYFETPSAGMRYKESIRKVGGEGEGEGFVDVYTEMADYLSQPKAARGASVDKFNANAQKVTLDVARGLTGVKNLSNIDIYTVLDKNTGNIKVVSMRDILDQNNRKLYSKGQPIGSITPQELNMTASKVLGVKGVRGAKTGTSGAKKQTQQKDPLGIL